MKNNCPNCGAIIADQKCSYCGAVFIDYSEIDPHGNKPFFVKLQGSILACRCSSLNLTLASGCLPEMEATFYVLEEVKNEV